MEANEWEENENENEEYPTYSDEDEVLAQGNIFQSASTPSDVPVEPVAEVPVAPTKKVVEEKQSIPKPLTAKPKTAAVPTPEQPKAESRPTTGGKGIPVADVESPKAPVKVIVKKPKPEPAVESKPVEVVAEPEKKKIVRPTTGGKMPANKIPVAVQVEAAKPQSYIPPRDETEENSSEDESKDKQSEDDNESEVETPAPKKKKAPVKKRSKSVSGTNAPKSDDPMIKSSADYAIKWAKIAWDDLDDDEPKYIPLFATIEDKNSSSAFTEKPNNLGEILEKIPLPNYLPIAVHKENKGDIRVFPQYPIAIAIDNWRKSSRYLENFKKKQPSSSPPITGINVVFFKSPRTTLSINDMIDILNQDCFTSHKKTACILAWLESLLTITENSIVDLSEDRLARYADNFKKLSGPFVAAKPRAKKPKESDGAPAPSKSLKKGKKDDVDDEEEEETTTNDEKEEREYQKQKARERKRDKERMQRKIATASSKNVDIPVAEVSKKRKAEHLTVANGHHVAPSKSKEKTAKPDDEDESDDESYEENSEDEDSFIVSEDEDEDEFIQHKSSKSSTSAKKNIDRGESKKSGISRKFDYISDNWGMIDERRQKKIKLHVEEAIHEIGDAIEFLEQRKKQRKFASLEKKPSSSSSSSRDGKKKRH